MRTFARWEKSEEVRCGTGTAVAHAALDPAGPTGSGAGARLALLTDDDATLTVRRALYPAL